MATWNINNRACTTVWITLYSTQQLTSNFTDSGALTMNELTFFNELSSSDQRSHEIAMLADQLDKIFINGRGAKYEPGVDHSSAVSSLIQVLSEAAQTVADLASVADSSYQFWGEPV
jgi:hypothetical protein